MRRKRRRAKKLSHLLWIRHAARWTRRRRSVRDLGDQATSMRGHAHLQCLVARRLHVGHKARSQKQLRLADTVVLGGHLETGNDLLRDPRVYVIGLTRLGRAEAADDECVAQGELIER